METTPPQVKISPPKHLLIFLLVIGVTFCAANTMRLVQKEGEFTYGNFQRRINGSVLNKTGSVSLTIEVEDDVECARQCVMNRSCLSVNFGKNQTAAPGKILCEILDWAGTDYERYLIRKEGFSHMRMETPCTVFPCPWEKQICIPYAINPIKSFSCLCPGSQKDLTNCATDQDDIKCNALGMQDSTIQNSQITASSEVSSSYRAINARLSASSSWVPADPTANSWLQIDFLKNATVIALATQGRSNAATWMRTYQLTYSNDGTTWNLYSEGEQKIFQANFDYTSIVKRSLKNPFVTRMVRFVVMTAGTNPGLRIELFGCYM